MASSNEIWNLDGRDSGSGLDPQTLFDGEIPIGNARTASGRNLDPSRSSEDDDPMEGDSLKSDSSNSSRSTGSTIPPSFDHPPVHGQSTFIVYFEPRNFHKSPNSGAYVYQNQYVEEEAAFQILADAFTPLNMNGTAVNYVQCAMCHMVKAIAQADKERAVHVEESNDTSGYRTLSCVLMENTISDRYLDLVVDTWRETANNDELLSHCADNIPLAKVFLLLSVTFRRSAPMLAWKLEVPQFCDRRIL